VRAFSNNLARTHRKPAVKHDVDRHIHSKWLAEDLWIARYHSSLANERMPPHGRQELFLDHFDNGMESVSEVFLNNQQRT